MSTGIKVNLKDIDQDAAIICDIADDIFNEGKYSNPSHLTGVIT